MQWLGCYNKLSCGHSDQRLSTLCSWPGKLHIHAFLFVLSSRPLSTIFKFRSVSVFLFMRLLLFPGIYFLFYSLSNFFYFHCIFFCSFVSPFVRYLQDSLDLFSPFCGYYYFQVIFRPCLILFISDEFLFVLSSCPFSRSSRFTLYLFPPFYGCFHFQFSFLPLSNLFDRLCIFLSLY